MQTSVMPRWVWRFFKNEQHSETLAFFRNISIFHGLTSRQLGRVMLAMQRRTYVIGERLFEEGAPGKAVFVIKSGRVELSRMTADGPRKLGVLGPGQMFGEMALLEQLNRTATATVIEDGEIFLLYTASLEALVRHHPRIGVRLLRNMAIMLSALLRRTNKELDRHTKAPV
jgi:CRP/FNR family transcriptional regulator, cyclic AMP receptor protein